MGVTPEREIARRSGNVTTNRPRALVVRRTIFSTMVHAIDLLSDVTSWGLSAVRSIRPQRLATFNGSISTIDFRRLVVKYTKVPGPGKVPVTVVAHFRQLNSLRSSFTMSAIPSGLPER